MRTRAALSVEIEFAFNLPWPIGMQYLQVCENLPFLMTCDGTYFLHISKLHFVQLGAGQHCYNYDYDSEKIHT